MTARPPQGAGTLGSLVDVVITGETQFNHLEYDGNNWVNTTALTFAADAATAGSIRFANGGSSQGGSDQAISFRNNAGTANQFIKFNETDAFLFEMTDGVQAKLNFFTNSSVSTIGQLIFAGINLGGGQKNYATVARVIIRNATAGAERAEVTTQILANGSNLEMYALRGQNNQEGTVFRTHIAIEQGEELFFDGLLNGDTFINELVTNHLYFTTGGTVSLVLTGGDIITGALGGKLRLDADSGGVLFISADGDGILFDVPSNDDYNFRINSIAELVVRADGILVPSGNSVVLDSTGFNTLIRDVGGDLNLRCATGKIFDFEIQAVTAFEVNVNEIIPTGDMQLAQGKAVFFDGATQTSHVSQQGATGMTFQFPSGSHLSIKNASVVEYDFTPTAFDMDKNLLVMREPGNSADYTITPLGISSDRILNLPLTVRTETLSILNSILGFSGINQIVAKGNTEFIGFGGEMQTTEANTDFYCPVAGTIRNMRVFLSENSSANAGNTVTVRHNGATPGSPIQVSYGIGVSGLLADTTNTLVVAAGDRIAIELVNTGSGGGTQNIVIETITLEYAAV